MLRDCLFFVAAATIVFQLLLGANAHTPLMWTDDLVWEYGAENWYFPVNAAESGYLREGGRWLIYVWYHMFGFRSGAFDLLISSIGWAVTTFTIGNYIFRGLRWGRASTIVFAALLFSSPMFFQAMLWPHTVAANMTISAICAVLIYLACDTKIALGAWVAALTILMLTYEPMALTFACVAVLRVIATNIQSPNGGEEGKVDTDPLKLIRQLVFVTAFTVCALAIAFLVQSTLQFVYFGTWEVQVPDWRRQTATADLTLMSSFERARYFISGHMYLMRDWLSGLPALAGSVWVIATLFGIYYQRFFLTPKKVLVFGVVAVVLASMYFAIFAIVFLEPIDLTFQATMPSWLVLSFIGGLSLLIIQIRPIRRWLYISLIAFVVGIAIRAEDYASQYVEVREALDSIVAAYAVLVLETVERHELDNPVVIGYGMPADFPRYLRELGQGADWVGAYLERRLHGKVSAVHICIRQENCSYISKEAAFVIGQSSLKREPEGERLPRILVLGDDIILNFDAHLYASDVQSF